MAQVTVAQIVAEIAWEVSSPSVTSYQNITEVAYATSVSEVLVAQIAIEVAYINDQVGTQHVYMLGAGGTQDTQGAYLRGKTGISDSKHAYICGTGQIIRPDGDITVGGWKNEVGGSTLYPSVSEDDPDDNTYAWYEAATVGSYFEVSLENPLGDTGLGVHIIRWRAYRKSGTSSVTLKCEIRQGSTSIAYDQKTMTDAIQQFETVLDCSSITDYTDLRVRITVVEVT